MVSRSRPRFWVQFNSYSVVGGTSASRPAARLGPASAPGFWFLLRLAGRGAGRQCIVEPAPAAVSRGRKVWMV